MRAKTDLLLASSLGFLFLLILLLLGLPGASGDTIIVDTNGNGDYTKVQAGLDAASDGDTVRVWEGTYFERVKVEVAVSIIGNGTDKTVIDGSNGGDVMQVDHDNVDISQLRLTRAGNSYRAVYIYQFDDVDLDHVQLDRSRYGLYASDGENFDLSYVNSSDNYIYGIYFNKVNYSTVSNGRFDDNAYGILLYDCYDNQITNNVFTKASNYGIYATASDTLSVRSNTFSDNLYGVYLRISSRMTVKDSDLLGNTYGVEVYNSDNATLSNNLLNDSNIAIRVISGQDHKVQNNRVENSSRYTIQLSSTRNVELSGNEMNHGGSFHLVGNTYTEWASHDIDTTNTLDGDPLYYASGGSSLSIPAQAAQIYLVDVEDTTIDGYQASGFEYGLVLAYCDNIEVLNSNLSGHTSYGAYLFHSNWTLLDEDVLSDNGQYGVYIYYGHNNTISNSTLDRNSRGIFSIYTNDATYYSNSLTRNQYGIYTQSSSRSRTLDNRFNNHTGYGVYHWYSNYFAIRDNDMEGNGNGMYIYNSDRGNVTGNSILNTTSYGVYSYSCYWVNFRENQVDRANRGLYLYYNYYNELTFNRVSNTSYGLFLYYFRYNDLLNNTLVQNTYGLYLSSQTYYNDYHNNTISGNRNYGLYDASGQTSNDATFNWWGNKTGPHHASKNPDGTGDNVTGNVDFEPWLGMSKPVRNQDSGENFWTLKAAVKAAEAGDTIRVWAGFYQENVVIEKTLTIIGNGTSNTTFRGAKGGGGGQMVATLELAADEVRLSHLALQGNGDNYVGLIVNASDSILDDLHFSASMLGVTITGNNNQLRGSNFTANVYSSTDSWADVYLVNADAARLQDNLFSQRGLLIHGNQRSAFDSHTITGNTLAGRPLYYCSGQSGKVISGDYGQLILVGCDDMTIKDQNLSHIFIGLQVIYSDNVELYDSQVTDSFYGLIFNQTSNVKVHDNLIQDIFYGGVQLETCDEGFIKANHVEQAAIRLENTTAVDVVSNHLNDSMMIIWDESSRILVEDNHLYRGSSSLQVADSREVRVFNNTVNTWSGLEVFDSERVYLLGNDVREGHGLKIETSQQVQVSDCYLESTYTALTIYYSDEVSVTHCIMTSSDRGVAVDGSSNVELHYNDIYDNYEWGLEASGSASQVDATHNYWGDMSGPYHADDNDQGQGNGIKERSNAQVTFDPWVRYPSFNERPVAYIDSVNPDPGLVFRDVTFTGHETDDGTVIQWVWGSNRFGEFHNSSLWTEEVRSDDLAPGMHVIYYKVMDNYGVWSLPATTTLKIFDAPNATYISVTPSPALDTDTLHFVGGGEDSQGANITRYRWKSSLDGQFYSDAAAEFDYSELSVGNHTLTLWVRNEYLLESNGLTTYLIINQRPVAKLNSISPASVVEGDSVTFEGAGLDNSQVVTYVWRSNLDGEFYRGPDTLITVDNLSVGQHTIYLQVLDDLGEPSLEVTGNLTVAALVNHLPQVVLSYPGNHAVLKGPVIIRGYASDDDGTVEKVEVQIGEGSDWVVANHTDSWNYELDSKTLKNGEYVVKVRAYDGQDYSVEKTVTVTVKNSGGGDDDSPGLGFALSLVGLVGAAGLRSRRRFR